MNLDGLSLQPLVSELAAKLVGGRIDKIFQPDKTTLLIWVRLLGENVALQLSANPQRAGIYLTAHPPANPPVPPAFCMLLRKHLEDGRIADVRQRGLDRVVSLLVDIRGERGLIVTKELIVEIMGKHSNIILVQDDVVLDAVKRVGYEVSRVRQILPGRDYLPPPGQNRLNPLTTPPEQIVAEIQKAADAQLTKAIVAAVEGLGPIAAREIVWRAGLPPDITFAALDQADTAALTEAVGSLFGPIAAHNAEPTIAVASDQSKLVGLAAFRLDHLAKEQLLSFPTMSAALEFAANFEGRPDNPEKIALLKFLGSELARLNRKQETLAKELTEAEGADELRRNADLLMINLHSVPTGTAEVALPDYYAENPEEARITLALDPLLSPIENAQRYYSKYNKAKRAQESLAEQLTACRAEIAYLDTVGVALEQAVSFDDTAEIRQELIQAGYIREKGSKRSQPPAAPLQAPLLEGQVLLIGRNNRQNDLVTFKYAKAEDYWFHTKDIPGSHVILRSGGGEPSPETLSTAAKVAAYFSKARQSSSVPVDYTRKRHVKKPAGAKPGFVIYDRQHTVYVTPVAAEIERLLAAAKPARREK